MIERINVPDPLLYQVADFLKENNIAKRGREDGSRRKQGIGLVGEIITYQFLTGESPDYILSKTTNDGGVDFTYKGFKIDVKTKGIRAYAQPDFEHTLYKMQVKYDIDILIFCYFNTKHRIVEICGWDYKDKFLERATFKPKGTLCNQGTSKPFTMREDNYSIRVKDLRPIEELNNIYEQIGIFT